MPGAAQDAILRSLSAGAPPDPFNPRGQNWGIAAFHPSGLIAEHFATFRRTLQSAMRHAGAIRIDHVLGLNRLFLIPHGASPADGAYFRFPLQALLAVVAQESVANRCIVIGEDLGTVPPDLRGQLADWGLWTYRVLMFERHADGGFYAPEHYPATALATFSTHDLPTFAGWSSGHDLAVRRALGVKESESDEERQNSRERLRAAVSHAGFDADSFAGIAGFLAATPSRLVVVQIEDLLGVKDQPNLPGTVDEHPNWRQRLPVAAGRLGAAGRRARDCAGVRQIGAGCCGVAPRVPDAVQHYISLRSGCTACGERLNTRRRCANNACAGRRASAPSTRLPQAGAPLPVHL